ncbi:MAG TPA: DUF3761 domain-containing protein [Candidatus Saccharimonadia bacterium]
MTLGRKLLIGVGSLFSLAVIGAASNPQPATTPIPSSTPVVLAAQASKSPTTSPSATPTPLPSPTVAKTPVPTPLPTAKPVVAVPATSSSGYTNSDGNYVPSPTHAAAPPAGATAQCADGTYSFSQHRSGTCSHHGGVAQWL